MATTTTSGRSAPVGRRGSAARSRPQRPRHVDGRVSAEASRSGRHDGRRRRCRRAPAWCAKPARSCPAAPRSRAPGSRRAARTRAGWPTAHVAHRAAGREEPLRAAWPRRGAAAASTSRAEGVVGLDDEERQQLVPAGHVAVDGRRHHADLAGHGAQRQTGGAVGRQLAPGRGQDLGGDLGTAPARGRPCTVGHRHQCARSHVTNESTALAFSSDVVFTDP